MNNSIITSLITILSIFVGLFLYTTFIGAIPFSITSVQTTKDSLFRVDGAGKATAVPDTALLSLGVTKNASSIQAAQSQANIVVNKLIADLKQLGVEEKNIKTDNYNVSPTYDYTSGKQSVTGYTVSQNLEVKVKPVDLANKITDIATADGANIVGGVTFVLDDKTQTDLENQARIQAISKAKEKAQSLANAAGIHLGRIIDVQENAGQPQPIRTMNLAMPGGGEAKDTTQLPPGENSVSITITLSYETH